MLKIDKSIPNPGSIHLLSFGNLKKVSFDVFEGKLVLLSNQDHEIL